MTRYLGVKTIEKSENSGTVGNDVDSPLSVVGVVIFG